VAGASGPAAAFGRASGRCSLAAFGQLWWCILGGPSHLGTQKFAELFFEGGFHVLEGAVDRVFTDRVVLEFREFVEATGYPLNAAALRAETIRWEQPL